MSTVPESGEALPAPPTKLASTESLQPQHEIASAPVPPPASPQYEEHAHEQHRQHQDQDQPQPQPPPQQQRLQQLDRELLEKKKQESLKLDRKAREDAEREARDLQTTLGAAGGGTTGRGSGGGLDGLGRVGSAQLRLSFLLRGQLVAMGNAMVATSGGTLPTVASGWAAEVLHTVFERYSSSALMREDHWAQFVKDAGFVHLYSPRDEVDEVADSFVNLLDARNVFDRVVGRLLSPELETEEHKSPAAGFNEFFQMLLLVCDLLGLKIFEQRGGGREASHDFQQLLLDVMVPMYHCGPGWGRRLLSKDALVSETRILLLLQSYLPNLWRVFLLYCQDAKGSAFSGPLNSFPAFAQRSEALLHGVRTKASPMFPGPIDPDAQALFVTERSMLRCAEHFGIVPSMCSERVFIKVFRANATTSGGGSGGGKRSSNDSRAAAASGGSKAKSRDASTSSATSPNGRWSPGMTYSQRKRHGLGATRRQEIEKHQQREHELKSRGCPRWHRQQPQSPVSSSSQAQPKRQERHGLAGFCEFVEILAKSALVGLDRPPYSALYPSPLAKVAAMLVGSWGLADPAKLHIAVVLNAQRRAASGTHEHPRARS